MFYLAEGTQYLPSDKLEKAQVLQWLFFEQYSHEPYIAVWKACTLWFGFSNRTEAEKKKLRERGQEALDVMEKHLEGREWFVGSSMTIADIGLWVYTESTEGFGWKVGANVRGWVERVKGQEGHVGLKEDPTGGKLRVEG